MAVDHRSRVARHPPCRVDALEAALEAVSVGTPYATEKDMTKTTVQPDDIQYDMIAGREICLLPAVRYDEHSMRTDHVIRVAGARATSSGRYRIGGVPRGGSGRQVDGGPLVPGPWAYVYELAGVIDNHGGTGAEAARKHAAGMEHDLVPGDVIRFDDCEYKIRLDARGFVRLETR